MSMDNCQICSSAKFKYSCPKCNILYCSVECYKSTKHQQCSEEFYRKCVQDEMAFSSTSGTISNDVQNMYNILQRTGNEQLIDEDLDLNNITEEEEIDSDDEDDLDIADRLQGVNINDSDEIWSRLTTEEKHEFESLIETGKITTLLPQFDLWWNVEHKNKLIEEISDNIVQPNLHPEILKNIQPFENLCKKEPSPCLWFNLCNILGAYTCTVRFFTDEHLLTPIEATKYIYLLSTNLNKNENFDSDEQAIKSIILETELSNNGLSIDDDYETIYENVQKIIHGPSRDNGKYSKIYKLAALSDLWRLFTEAKKQLYHKKIVNDEKITNNFTAKYSDFKAGNVEVLTKPTISNLIKKIEYFLSFVNKQSN